MENSHRVMEIRFGCHDTKGMRIEMEDSWAVDCTDSKLKMFAVFDGHGGNLISKDLQDHFLEYVRKKWNEWYIMEEGDRICRIFTTFDERYSDEKYRGKGSTVAIVIITENGVWIANVGDTEVMMMTFEKSNFEYRMMTKRHNVKEDKTEEERVLKLGAYIWMNRVSGVLAVSRSFGDYDIGRTKEGSKYISSEPHVVFHKFHPGKKFIFTIGSDGMWDYVQKDVISKKLHEKCASLQLENIHGDRSIELDNISKEFCKLASDGFSHDNITCMIVYVEC